MTNLLGAAIQVYSVTGTLVKSTNAEAETTTLDLSPMPSGFYVIRSGSTTIKVMRK